MKTTPMRELYQRARGLSPDELQDENLVVTIGGKVKTVDHPPGATLLGLEDGTLDVRFQEPVLVVITHKTRGVEKISHVIKGCRVYATGVTNKPRIKIGRKQVLVLTAEMVLVED